MLCLRHSPSAVVAIWANIGHDWFLFTARPYLSHCAFYGYKFYKANVYEPVCGSLTNFSPSLALAYAQLQRRQPCMADTIAKRTASTRHSIAFLPIVGKNMSFESTLLTLCHTNFTYSNSASSSTIVSSSLWFVLTRCCCFAAYSCCCAPVAPSALTLQVKIYKPDKNGINKLRWKRTNYISHMSTNCDRIKHGNSTVHLYV